jgi:hypothetical protein
MDAGGDGGDDWEGAIMKVSQKFFARWTKLKAILIDVEFGLS